MMFLFSRFDQISWEVFEELEINALNTARFSVLSSRMITNRFQRSKSGDSKLALFEYARCRPNSFSPLSWENYDESIILKYIEIRHIRFSGKANQFSMFTPFFG
jgi:hypothetical protein